MPYLEAKIYNDGSHYIAIPHTTGIKKARPKKMEEVVTLQRNISSDGNVSEETVVYENPVKNDEDIVSNDNLIDMIEKAEKAELQTHSPTSCKISTRTTTRSQEFNTLYKESVNMSKSERENYLIKGMQKFFKSDEATSLYVKSMIEKKKRNLICRRMRFCRKAYLHKFNYFVTFTYDDKKHTAESFKKKLSKCLNNLHTNKGWLYMGVWEKSPTGRLHFHGLFKIEDGKMPGEMIEVRDYSTVYNRMQTTNQNTFFIKKFGRCDFSPIDPSGIRLGNAMSYLLKYLEKTDEKIVYSRGLPMYVISDIDDDDVITNYSEDSNKLILFDDFSCYDEGEYLGTMNEETIKKMRTANS